MGIFRGTLLLKQRALQKQFSHQWRYRTDLKYRQFWDDYDRLENLLTEPRQIEEEIEPEKLKNWTPIDLYLTNNFQGVAWLNLGKTYFTDKRSAYTVCRSWQSQNKPQPIWTTLDALTKLRKTSPGLTPKGFIFNVSKCGSTLLAKMLSSLPRNVVVSEDTVINKSLMPNELMAEPNGFPEPRRIELFQSVVSALGQPRLGVEENYVIRFSPKDVLGLPFIKKVFPEVPCIFLYRNPLEVVVSDLIDLASYKGISKLVRQVLDLSAMDITQFKSKHFHLAKQILDFSASEIATMSDEEFLARRNGLYAKAALCFLDKQDLFINYDQLLSNAGLNSILDFFGVQVSDSEIAKMLDQLKIYSKENLKARDYKDDRADKKKMASARLRNLIDQWAMEPYLRLEEMRQNIMF